MTLQVAKDEVKDFIHATCEHGIYSLKKKNKQNIITYRSLQKLYSKDVHRH
jgi:hypothetical protein